MLAVKRTRLVVMASILVLVSGFWLLNVRQWHSDGPQSAKDQVYAAVIRARLWQHNGKSKPRQPLFDTAVESSGCAGTNQTSCEDLLRKHFSTGGDGILHTDTIDDFIVESRVGGPLSKTFETDLPHSFVVPSAFSREKVKTLSDGYRPCYELFPGADGILALSHVGFNHDMTEALVCSSLFCSGLCGNGQTHVLRKRRGKWVVVISHTDWVS